MREHSEASLKMEIFSGREHGALDSDFSLLWDLLKVFINLKDVWEPRLSFIQLSLLFLLHLSLSLDVLLIITHCPCQQSRSCLERPKQMSRLNQLKLTFRSQKRSRNHRFILHRIIRTSWVSKYPILLQQPQPSLQNLKLERMQTIPIIQAPGCPFLRNLSNSRIRTAGNITQDPVKQESCVHVSIPIKSFNEGLRTFHQVQIWEIGRIVIDNSNCSCVKSRWLLWKNSCTVSISIVSQYKSSIQKLFLSTYPLKHKFDQLCSFGSGSSTCIKNSLTWFYIQ